MKVDTKELATALEAVKPGISKKDIVEQMTHFIFTKDAVTTYDDQLCVSYPIETGLKCTVKADTLSRLVKRIEAKTLVLKMKEVEEGEGEQLLVKSTGLRGEIPVLIDEDIYQHVAEVQKQEKAAKWVKIPKGLLAAMEFCMFAASKDAQHPHSTCVGIKGKDVVASDKVRIGWGQIEESTRKNFMISALSTAELVRFGGFITFCVSDTWVHFKTRDKAIFHIRRNKGDYPITMCKKLFDGFSGISLYLSDGDREAILEAVNTSSAISEVALIEKTVKMSFEKGKVTCESTSESGTVSRTRKIKYDGDEFSFYINPIFISQILNRDEPTELIVGERMINLKADNMQHLLALRSV